MNHAECLNIKTTYVYSLHVYILANLNHVTLSTSSSCSHCTYINHLDYFDTEENV